MGRQWHILGAGAIGSLLAFALTEGGARVELVTRAHAGDKSRRPITLHRGADSSTLSFATSAPTASALIERLIITTKAYDVMSALAGIEHRLAPNCQVLLLVNGMGLMEAITERFPQLALYCGTTTEGAYRQTDGSIVHAGHGVTRLGRPGQPEPPSWYGDWGSLTLNCCWETDILAALWHKLAVNCAINPLTAVHRCPNGSLASEPELAEQLHGLCEEIAAVCLAAGQPAVAGTVHEHALDVVHRTAQNRSSMLQDIEADRPTELEYITGYLLSRGTQLGIALPANQALYKELAAHDHSR